MKLDKPMNVFQRELNEFSETGYIQIPALLLEKNTAKAIVKELVKLFL